MGLDARLDAIDLQIEDLRGELDGCRQSIALSRAAVWLGGIVLALVFTLVGSYRTAPVIFGAITVTLGGLVWLGASRSSREEARARLADAEALKSRLIDEVAARNGWPDMTPTVH